MVIIKWQHSPAAAAFLPTLAPVILNRILFYHHYQSMNPPSSPSSAAVAPASSLSSLSFSSPQTLSEWLNARLPSQDHLLIWGLKPGTKTISNLWLELSHGETLLHDSIPPKRTVYVASVNIRNARGNLRLVEALQEMSDGSLRQRNRPLSEKMKPGESIEEASRRALCEELGADHANRVRILMDSYEKSVEERNSGSYPGMPACYVIHSVDAVVEEGNDGLLPERGAEFWTEEEGEEEHNGCEGAVVVKRHLWKWVPVDDEKEESPQC